jgi:hypothetical protein
MTDCPNCEWHKDRAARWRDEAYRQAGHPLPEREWVGLTDEDNIDWEEGGNLKDLVNAIESKLKEKNNG